LLRSGTHRPEPEIHHVPARTTHPAKGIDTWEGSAPPAFTTRERVDEVPIGCWLELPACHLFRAFDITLLDLLHPLLMLILHALQFASAGKVIGKIFCWFYSLTVFCRKFLFYLFDEGLWCDFFLLAGF